MTRIHARVLSDFTSIEERLESVCGGNGKDEYRSPDPRTNAANGRYTGPGCSSDPRVNEEQSELSGQVVTQHSCALPYSSSLVESLS